MTIAGKGGNFIGGPPGSGADLPFTYFAILKENPAHFWRLNTTNGGAFGTGAGDSGWDNQSLNQISSAGFVLDAENPMVIAEPFTSAVDFGSAIQTGRFNSVLGLAEMDDYLTGTVIVFFKIASENLTIQYFVAQTNVGGATTWVFRLRGDISNQDIEFLIVNNGPNFYRSSFVNPIEVSVDDWHMCAIRQPGNDTSVNWFYDGVFFDVSDSEVTDELAGTFIITPQENAWLFHTLSGPNPATTRGIGAFPPTGILGVNGRLFNVVIDDSVWSDAALTGLWNQAIANGLAVE